MELFKYGRTELEHLRKRDRRLGRAIDEIGPIEREVIPDPFAALVHTIVGQQISSRAAAANWSRMQERFGGIRPETIAAASPEELRRCGLSARKAGYVRDIDTAVVQGDLNLDGLHDLSDDDVIRQLTALPGIGLWSAEMVLIFSLQRPDVVSWGDLAIRRGMMNLYGLNGLTRDKFDRYRRRYSPYGSVASLYLWAVSHR
jgi:3-methyladenine DNA glycosylase/8-oxoguanine DNA glycosylase